jgi:hypothetical protein
MPACDPSGGRIRLASVARARAAPAGLLARNQNAGPVQPYPVGTAPCACPAEGVQLYLQMSDQREA